MKAVVADTLPWQEYVQPREGRLEIKVLLAGEAGVPLVERDRVQLEPHRRATLEDAEELQQGVGILASGDPDHDPIALGDQAEFGDGPAHVTEQTLLQA